MHSGNERSHEEKDWRYEAALRLQTSGRNEEAFKLFRKWQKQADDLDEKLIYTAGMVDNLNWLDKHDEALRLVKEYSSLRSRSDQAALAFGLSAASTYVLTGGFENAASIYSTLLDTNEYLKTEEMASIELDTRIRCATALIQMRSLEDARVHLKKVLEKSTDQEQIGRAKVQLGACEYVLEHTELAISYIQDALGRLRELRNQVEGHFYLGAAYMKAARYSDAVKQFEFCRANKGTGAIDPKLIDEMYTHSTKMKASHPS